MQMIVFLCLVAMTLAATKPQSLILNGSPAALFPHPSQASIQVQSNVAWSHLCGAAIISITKIVTAAHCLEGKFASGLRIVVGAFNLNDETNAYKQIVDVASFVIHDSYNSNGTGNSNDIGIITLQNSLTLNANVQIAALAPKGSSFANTNCVITEWGCTDGDGTASPTLQEVRITTVTTADCAARWPGQNITDKHICVSDAPAASGTRPSACNGDSGGPMMCGSNFQYLAGIKSRGVSNSSGSYSSVYTRVTSFLDYILNSV